MILYDVSESERTMLVEMMARLGVLAWNDWPDTPVTKIDVLAPSEITHTLTRIGGFGKISQPAVHRIPFEQRQLMRLYVREATPVSMPHATYDYLTSDIAHYGTIGTIAWMIDFPTRGSDLVAVWEPSPMLDTKTYLRATFQEHEHNWIEKVRGACYREYSCDCGRHYAVDSSG